MTVIRDWMISNARLEIRHECQKQKTVLVMFMVRPFMASGVYEVGMVRS